MPVCAKAIQQPDGTLLLALDPANPNLSTCPYVVDDGASNAWRELGNLSISDAAMLSFAVGGVWVIAWGFKSLGRALGSSRLSEEE
jgi:hypothetical protein